MSESFLGPPKDSPEYAAWASENKGPQLITITWTVTAVGFLFASARLYVRAGMQKRLHLDDYFIIISVVTGLISCALTTIAVNHGFGRHYMSLTPEEQKYAVIWTLSAFCPGVMSFGFPKLAVIALLTRLLLPGRAHYCFLWGMGFVVEATLFATCGVLLGRCYPISYFWDKTVDGSCFSVNIEVGYCIYAGVISAFADLYLAFYPGAVLYGLRMPLRKKLALACALGFGTVSGVVAIYKTTRIPSLASPDFTYATADLQLWTVIEGSSIVMASSIPVLQPLIEKFFGTNILGSGYRNGHYNMDFSKHGKLSTKMARRVREAETTSDLEMTVHDRGDSEENILSGKEQAFSRASGPLDVDSDRTDITRTREVSVTYEQGKMRKDIGIKSWSQS